MGNTNSQPLLTQYPVLTTTNHWQKLASLSCCDLVQHRLTAYFGYSYTLPISNIPNELRLYQFRYDNPTYLATVHNVILPYQELLCGICEEVTVVTERMPYRLSDFGLLTYLECLYAMRCLLKGGILIENQFGYVSYHESMVYINECGQCKLWINNNLYSNEWVSASVNSVSQVEILMEYVEMRMYGKFVYEYKKKKKIQMEKQMNRWGFKYALRFVEGLELENKGEYVNCFMVSDSIGENTGQYQLYYNHQQDYQLLKKYMYNPILNRDSPRYDRPRYDRPSFTLVTYPLYAYDHPPPVNKMPPLPRRRTNSAGRSDRSSSANKRELGGSRAANYGPLYNNSEHLLNYHKVYTAVDNVGGISTATTIHTKITSAVEPIAIPSHTSNPYPIISNIPFLSTEPLAASPAIVNHRILTHQYIIQPNVFVSPPNILTNRIGNVKITFHSMLKTILPDTINNRQRLTAYYPIINDRILSPSQDNLPSIRRISFSYHKV